MSTTGWVLSVLGAAWIGGLGGLVAGVIAGERRREALQNTQDRNYVNVG